MTDPALSSTRNHQGRPWFGPGAGTPVEVRVGPKTTAGHGRGSRRSLINGICYSATRTIRAGTRTVSEALRLRRAASAELVYEIDSA